MIEKQIVVIGAGMAGLVAALLLAARGLDVTLVETAATPGGKMRQLAVGGVHIDAGPTVFTMRHVFEAILAEAGESLDDHLALQPLDMLARHAWAGGERLDLFADIQRSADAIGVMAGVRQARAYLDFCTAARQTFLALQKPVIEASQPGMGQMLRIAGIGGMARIARTRPFATLWSALADHFANPLLRQLFSRYATYCGSSPYQAPAALMLIAHVEQSGVWSVAGGMHKVAQVLAGLAQARGAKLRFGQGAREILVQGGRVSGLVLDSGETLNASAIIANCDHAALAGGLLGASAARAVPAAPPAQRSLSALTWTLLAKTSGFVPARHNVFFSDDYAAEFSDIFKASRLPRAPTVYVCAQDRDNGGAVADGQPERLLCLVNAPAIGDRGAFDPREIGRCETTTFSHLARCGLTIQRQPELSVTTSPSDFNRLFPATGGALYGRATHGWAAPFQRPGHRTKLPGLYLAGGSVHPGAGVPMAALSGRIAAQALMADWGLMRR